MKESDDYLYSYSEAATEIFRLFGRGSFEYYHIRNKIPDYSIGLHRKLIVYNYLEVARVSGKARIWKVADKTLKLVEESCKH